MAVGTHTMKFIVMFPIDLLAFKKIKNKVGQNRISIGMRESTWETSLCNKFTIFMKVTFFFFYI